MAAKLFHVDTVVVGRFNPFIITPDWVKKEKIVETEPGELMFGFGGKEIAFRFKTGPLDWQVDSGRLVVSSDNSSKNTAAIASKVIDKLPHTPLTALGNNFHYRCDPATWTAGRPMLGTKLDFEELASEGTVQSSSWAVSIEKPEGFVLVVSVEQTAEKIQVNMNFHRQVGDESQAKLAAAQFEQDLNECKNWLTNVIGQKVEE